MQKDIAQMRRELHEFYFHEVKPVLKSLNAKRKKKAVTAYIISIILIGVLISIILPMVGVLLIFGGTFLLIFLDDKKNSNVVDFSGEMEIKQIFMPKFLNIFGENFLWQKWGFNQEELAKFSDSTSSGYTIASSLQATQDYQRYNKMNLLPCFPVFNIDDCISGIYRDVKFSINEYDSTIFKLGNLPLLILVVVLVLPLASIPIYVLGFNLLGKLLDLCHDFWSGLIVILLYVFSPIIILGTLLVHWQNSTRFKGVVVEFDMNKNFEGHTFVLENAKTANCIKFDHSKFEEIKLEDVEFNKKYNVYSNDQIESRYILTTGFMERFLNMKTVFKAKYIRAAFKDGKISIAMHVGKDLFAMGSLNKDTDSNTFTELFDEILSVLELINELKLNQKIGL